jgi:hypothetical protein
LTRDDVTKSINDYGFIIVAMRFDEVVHITVLSVAALACDRIMQLLIPVMYLYKLNWYNILLDFAEIPDFI